MIAKLALAWAYGFAFPYIDSPVFLYKYPPRCKIGRIKKYVLQNLFSHDDLTAGAKIRKAVDVHSEEGLGKAVTHRDKPKVSANFGCLFLHRPMLRQFGPPKLVTLSYIWRHPKAWALYSDARERPGTNRKES